MWSLSSGLLGTNKNSTPFIKDTYYLAHSEETELDIYIKSAFLTVTLLRALGCVCRQAKGSW